jgi:hypothetical protein
MGLTDHAREVRSALCDPGRLVVGLGLEKGATRQAGGFVVPCPAHADRSPSCSVTRGPDGTVRVKCFGCDFSGDALTLIGQVLGLSTRDRDGFREILAEGARIAGAHALEAEIRDGTPAPDRKPVPRPAPLPERDYLPVGDVAAFWRECTPVTEDPEASRYLVGRLLDPELVATRGLARVIPASVLPRWATYGGGTWNETGHRIAVRAFDAQGRARGVRAMRVRDGDGPKRLPPAGFRAAGLALLNAAAHRMLRGETFLRVVVVEGEPDHLTWATKTEDPVVGVLSGTWTDAFAAAIPSAATIVIRTHNDDAGDRYAARIVESLEGRCGIRRSVA